MLTTRGLALRASMTSACFVALLGACDKKGSGPAGAVSAEPPASSAAAETGIPECDVFLAEYRCFLTKQLPQTEADSTFATMRDSFKAAGSNPADRANASESCKQQHAMQAASFARSGCATGTAGKAVVTDAGAPAPAVDPYPLSAIKPIAESCQSPGVLITSAPRKAGVEYHWQWIRQTMYANRQLEVVSAGPTTAGQVEFQVVEDDTSIHLVGFCKDGGTCNRLAAMVKAVVRSSNPQAFCGHVPVKGDQHASMLVPADGVWLPMDKADVVARCARLSACMIAADIATPGDPGLECQRVPGSFRTDCATRESCADVLACTKR